MAKVYDIPSQVKAEDGVVSVDGPDGVDILMTPDAALETSERLWESATEAHGQRVRAHEFETPPVHKDLMARPAKRTEEERRTAFETVRRETTAQVERERASKPRPPDDDTQLLPQDDC